jgi:hypothetical protein
VHEPRPGLRAIVAIARAVAPAVTPAANGRPEIIVRHPETKLSPRLQSAIPSGRNRRHTHTHKGAGRRIVRADIAIPYAAHFGEKCAMEAMNTTNCHQTSATRQAARRPSRKRPSCPQRYFPGSALWSEGFFRAPLRAVSFLSYIWTNRATACKARRNQKQCLGRTAS